MENIPFILITIGALAYAYFMFERQAQAKNQALNQMSRDMKRAKQFVDSLDDERRINQEAMQQAFDYINENGPWGVHDVPLMQVRNVLMHAITNSTFGRGK